LFDISTYNTAAMILKGTAKINNTNEANEGNFILFNNTSGEVIIEGQSNDTLVFVMSGEPINELIFQHGPFVMNSREEIIEAFNDFQSGKMGSTNF
jgi:redox-sensitive bicupin YhaK (pirin superfamily)